MLVLIHCICYLHRYDSAARRLGRAINAVGGGGGNSSFGLRRSASRGSYRSFYDGCGSGYGSEASGFSGYSAMGPQRRYRGAPSAAGSVYDAAFEQGYRYAGVL